MAPCYPPLTERLFTAEEAERAARMFKALGDPVRLRLISLAASHEDGEACVCDISDVGLSQPTVSHHLKKLREAGLLTSERRGTWVYYRVELSVLAAMGKLLAIHGREESRPAAPSPYEAPRMRTPHRPGARGKSPISPQSGQPR